MFVELVVAMLIAAGTATVICWDSIVAALRRQPIGGAGPDGAALQPPDLRPGPAFGSPERELGRLLEGRFARAGLTLLRRDRPRGSIRHGGDDDEHHPQFKAMHCSPTPSRR